MFQKEQNYEPGTGSYFDHHGSPGGMADGNQSGYPLVVDEIELRERMIRVEEELKHQRELMQQGFAMMEKRFQQVDKRFK